MSEKEYDPDFPEWATCKSSGNYMEVGAQLCTRNGRKVGNAVVISITTQNGLATAECITDSGNSLILTITELEELFHEPRFLMDISSHIGVDKFYHNNIAGSQYE